MQLRNSNDRYGTVTKSLHWVIFAMFTFQFVVGFVMAELEAGEHAFGATMATLFDWHQTVGLLALALIAVRLAWRRFVPLPSWAPGLGPRERSFAHIVEVALYAAMIFKPISGYLFAIADRQGVELFSAFSIGEPFGESGGLADTALAIRMISGIVFLAAWVLHVGLVLKHQLLKRDRHLNRMLPFTHQ